VYLAAVRGIEQRWRWLGHPAFLVAVATLLLNDHVL